MDHRLGEVRSTAARAAPQELARLEDWLRIPSVSGSRARAGDVDRAAAWVADRLRRVTPAVATRRTAQGPVVAARTRGHRPGPLTVVYGHLDVKPAGPGWTSPPFAPTRRGDRLVARGASDDKGQLMLHLAALAAWAAHGGPPGDVVTLVDGTEEVGSPGLEPVLATWRRDLLAGPVGAVVVVDTRAAGPCRPTVTVSQRGVVALRVSVDVGGAPVHAGRLGGAVVDPALVLAAALLRAAHVLETTTAPGPRTRAHLPTEAALRAVAGARALRADDPVGRATTRGALTVSRLDARAARGAVPVRAGAVLDVRLPPGAAPDRALRRLRAALRHDLPPGVRLEVEAGPASAGLDLLPAPAVLRAVERATRTGCRRTPVTAASGASIPAVGVLARVLGATPVLLGLGPVHDGAHGPDEHLDLGTWGPGIDTHVVLLDALASIRREPGRERRPTPAPPATVARVVEAWGSRATRSGVT
ncbi:MAG: M20/M25/M40 family metallo-hydrolase [Nocardioides sp.]